MSATPRLAPGETLLCAADVKLKSRQQGVLCLTTTRLVWSKASPHDAAGDRVDASARAEDAGDAGDAGDAAGAGAGAGNREHGARLHEWWLADIAKQRCNPDGSPQLKLQIVGGARGDGTPPWPNPTFVFLPGDNAAADRSRLRALLQVL